MYEGGGGAENVHLQIDSPVSKDQVPRKEDDALRATPQIRKKLLTMVPVTKGIFLNVWVVVKRGGGVVRMYS